MARLFGTQFEDRLFMLSKLLKSRRPAAALPAIPAGQRVYAVGDIHGRADLLDQLLARIDADDLARGQADTTIIFLGDLVDRGSDSAGVVERLRSLAATRSGVRLLMGNHEEVMLHAMNGDEKAIRMFCRIGGRETLLSYGMDPQVYERLDYDGVRTELHARVPESHSAFLAGFEDMIVIGDYAFVHAGIHPGKPLTQQSRRDFRWIRNTFLDHRGALEKHIVHGHTIVPEPDRRPFRTNIDTGAYESGRLTALGLEADDFWTLTS